MQCLIQEKMTHEQISYKLKAENPSVRGLSAMSVRRFCKQHGIGRNCKLTNEEIREKIIECSSEVSVFLFWWYCNFLCSFTYNFTFNFYVVLLARALKLTLILGRRKLWT